MATDKKSFRAPTTGDPREIEVAFELLNQKLEDITNKLDAALAAREAAQSERASTSRTTAASNAAQITVNATSISDNNTAQTAALAAQQTSLETAYDAAIADLIEIDATLTDLAALNGLQTVDALASPSGSLQETKWNSDIAPSIDTAFGNINADIVAMSNKCDEIAAIVRTG